jgi:hypothetical protein
MLAERLQTKLKHSGAPQAPREVWGLWNDVLGWADMIGPNAPKLWYETEHEAQIANEYFAAREITFLPVNILELVGRGR